MGVRGFALVVIVHVCAVGLFPGIGVAQGDDILRKVGFVALPGYSGDFDHILVDPEHNRLLLAAEDHGTLELFSLNPLRHVKTLHGVETPHAFLALPQANLLVVTDSGKSGSKLFKYTTLEPKGVLKSVGLGADSMEYDPTSKHAFIATGGKDAKMTEAFLEEVDPISGRAFSKIKFDTNSLQGVALERAGPRIFVMDQGNNQVVVVDRTSHKILSQWPIKDVGQAAMVGLDEPNHRLFVGTRKPGKLIVLDSDTGAMVATLTAPEKVDQLIFDRDSYRIYLLGGDGTIAVYHQDDANTYTETRIASAEGAKTGVLVPSLHRLFAAVSPGDDRTSGGGLLEYEVLTK